jgi:hypothetical protein
VGSYMRRVPGFPRTRIGIGIRQFVALVYGLSPALCRRLYMRQRPEDSCGCICEGYRGGRGRIRPTRRPQIGPIYDPKETSDSLAARKT